MRKPKLTIAEIEEQLAEAKTNATECRKEIELLKTMGWDEPDSELHCSWLLNLERALERVDTLEREAAKLRRT